MQGLLRFMLYQTRQVPKKEISGLSQHFNEANLEFC